ncbi:MAG: hypothetical protein WC305_06245 [Bacteroidales bacterium]|jgi:hypothetical protein|nr:hypothetical protein [Candidatus Paceibacterota bacterium]
MDIKQTIVDNKKYIIFGIILLVIGLFVFFYIKKQDEQLQKLKIAYAENVGQLEILQTLSQEQLVRIEEQKKTITALQKERDKAVKEAVKNAYTQGSSIADSDVLNAWNETINRARKRNTERKNNLANN